MPTLYHARNQAYIDADKNISSQVLDRQRKHIAAFSSKVKPKSSNDEITQVNVETSIEALLELMNTKVSILETIINRGGGNQNQPQYIASYIKNASSYLDMMRLYNNIIRYYKQASSSYQVRENIKLRLNDLNQFVNALVIGYEASIAKTRNGTLVNALGLIKIIKTQLDSSVFDLIRESDLQRGTRDAIIDMTQEQRDNISVRPLLNNSAFTEGIEEGNMKVKKEKNQRGEEEEEEEEKRQDGLFEAGNPRREWKQFQREERVKDLKRRSNSRKKADTETDTD